MTIMDGSRLASRPAGAAQHWIEVCALTEIPRLGARVVARPGDARGNVALFRTGDDRVFALADRCPHKGGPLSEGIVHGDRVTCPLHNWTIALHSGDAIAPDQGCAASFPVRVADGQVFVMLDRG
jgi:nitrite reductase (NADH) small subunit